MFYVGTSNHRLVIDKCITIAEKSSMEVFRYNISKGLSKPGTPNYNTEFMDPLQMLDMILTSDNRLFKRRLYILDYFDSLMENQDPLLMTKLRLVRDKTSLSSSVILTGETGHVLPESIANIPRIDLQALSDSDISHIINAANDYKDEEDISDLIRSLQGLTETECENLLALSLVKNQSLDHSFLEDKKIELISKKLKGLIRIYHPEYTLEDVGGLDSLKSWLNMRGRLFNKNDDCHFPTLPQPKGIILTGPPGCGKSFISEAIAGSWNINLVRLEPALCFNSLVGRTEDNFHTAFELIKNNLTPCVLILEEFEKFFPGNTGNSSDGGVSSRVLGILLDFLQSQRDGIFVCATTNGVHNLSPEVTRSLRFDACWFIDLPQRTERKKILNLLLVKYLNDTNITLSEKIIDACEYFSVAEMEQALIEAMVYCADRETELNELILLNAINEIIPLAVSRENDLTKIREWAPGRARMASTYLN